MREDFRQDIRYALRGLPRNPGFTITVALTFALGVGAKAAVFSLIEPLMLRTPPGLVEPGRGPGRSLPGVPHAWTRLSHFVPSEVQVRQKLEPQGTQGTQGTQGFFSAYKCIPLRPLRSLRFNAFTELRNAELQS